MIEHDAAEAERFEAVLHQSIRHVLRFQDPEPFLDWARLHLPALLGMHEDDLGEAERRRLATLIATAIWNVTPLPGHAFQTRPLPAPTELGSCPCGSGARHRDCCGISEEEIPHLSPQLVWEILLDMLPDSRIREALALDAIPRPLFSRVADRWLEQDQPRRASILLESLFSGRIDTFDKGYEHAIDVLCDAYDRLGHWRKKQAFLSRICAEGDRTLQAAGWQRRCTMAIDQGDVAGADAAFIAALRSDPDNPSNAVLEITLLTTLHKLWQARERARFWVHRLRRMGHPHSAVIPFLLQAIENPYEALADTHADALDPILLDLRNWAALVATRSLPRYRLDDLKARGPSRAQLSLFDMWPEDTPSGHAHADGPASAGPVGWRLPEKPVRLRAPKSLCPLEASWRARFPLQKPSSTQLVPDTDDDPWTRDEWIELLFAQPSLADSIEVLDDLATALSLHPSSTLPWTSRLLAGPILERAWSIIQLVLPPDSPHQIPWAAASNRPALRLLFRRYLHLVAEGDSRTAAEMLETLLRLDPQDHQGARAELMNHYLRDGEDELALGLAKRFPGDSLADLAYGEVLALYRLGRQERARHVLANVVHRLPDVPRYLTRDRVKRPHSRGTSMTPGSDDQAWLYRETMRDVWEAEPGILDWLKRLTA